PARARRRRSQRAPRDARRRDTTTRHARRLCRRAGALKVLAAVLGELFERGAGDGVTGNDGHSGRRGRSQRRLPRAAFEERPLADERARTDLRHLLAVDLHREDAVQQEVELVAGLALLDERLADPEPPPLPRGSALHRLPRDPALELAPGRAP